MSGFTDANVVFRYAGDTKYLYSASTQDWRFRMLLPEFVPGTRWGAENTRALIVTASGAREVIEVDTDDSSVGFWDEVGGWLWLKPAVIAAWGADLSAVKIVLLYRPGFVQSVDPVSLSDLDVSALVTQLNRMTRLAQITFELARRSLNVLQEEDDEFTGNEVGAGILPPLSELEGKGLGVLGGRFVGVETDAAIAALALAGKANSTYVDAQDAAEYARAYAAERALTGVTASAVASGQNVQTAIKNGAISGRWTSAVGALGTPEGTGTVVWNYLYWGDGTDGRCIAWKTGALADDSFVVNLSGGTWGTWMVPGTPKLNFVYIQGPADATPSSLWPNTTWTNVSSEEAGAFRRFEGGAASAFNSGVQDGTYLSNHVFQAVTLTITNGENSSASPTENQGPGATSTGGGTIYRFRPVNYTVRKWRRTA